MPAGDFVLRDGQTVLFIGDSITDCGRRDAHAPLGDGYVRLIAALSAARHPGRRIEFVNMGVGGNTISHLSQRWETDVLAQRPDWLSVSIGVNDVWRQIDRKGPGVPLEQYTAMYRELLSTTRGRLPGVGLVLMSPSVIGESPDSEGNRMLEPYVRAVEQLAGRFDAFFVPIHQAFLDAIAAGNGRAWTRDGVHPTPAGHALMALRWLGCLAW